jgi:hypothetical protein
MFTRNMMFHTHSVMDKRTSIFSERKVCFQHAVFDFYTQMSVILTRTNVIRTLTTKISSRTRVITTRRVWFSHVIWVSLWHSRKCLWHSYVSKPDSACINHSCVWCSHAYCEERKVWLQQARLWFICVDSDFHSQSVITTLTIVIFQHAQE